MAGDSGGHDQRHRYGHGSVVRDLRFLIRQNKDGAGPSDPWRAGTMLMQFRQFGNAAMGPYGESTSRQQPLE
jgi:hypothetical protein